MSLKAIALSWPCIYTNSCITQPIFSFNNKLWVRLFLTRVVVHCRGTRSDFFRVLPVCLCSVHQASEESARLIGIVSGAHSSGRDGFALTPVSP